MGNDAVNVNGFSNNSGVTDNHITSRGSSWYFAVCAIMAVSAAGCVGWGMTKPRQQRIFFYLCALINFVASIAYFTMGSNLGWAAIQVEFQRQDPEVGGNFRQIFYARYIDWFLTTPMLLMDLLLTCALPWGTILSVIFVNEIMIVTGLIGALVHTSYKFGYFVFGCFAFFYVVYVVVFEGRSYARGISTDVSRVYTICGVWTIGLWFLYPIAWGVSEGGNVISSDSEAIFYGILDILAKPVFSFLLLWGHRNIDIETLGLHVRGFDELPGGSRGIGTHHEKKPTGATAETTIRDV